MVSVWLLFHNHTCRNRPTDEYRKLFKKSKTTFKLTSYCQVLWDTLYLIKVGVVDTEIIEIMRIECRLRIKFVIQWFSPVRSLHNESLAISTCQKHIRQNQTTLIKSIKILGISESYLILVFQPRTFLFLELF